MSFGDGLDAFNTGLRLMRRRSIQPFIWAPALVSLAIILLSLTAVFAQIDAAVAWLLSYLPDSMEGLGRVLRPLAYIIGALLATWLFGYVATIVASPFLGVLAARVEQELRGTSTPTDQSMLTTIASAFSRELRKLLYHAPRALAVLLLTLIPVINLVAAPLWLIFGAWMVAVQFCDYAGENDGSAFSETLRLLRTHRRATFGLGAPALAILSLPLLNFIAVPAVVVGATVLRVRFDDADRPAPV